MGTAEKWMETVRKNIYRLVSPSAINGTFPSFPNETVYASKAKLDPPS